MVGTQILFIFFCNAAWTTASDLWCCHDVNYVSSEARNSRSNPGCAGRVPWRSWPCWPWWPWRSYWSCAWWTTAQFWAPRLWAGASQTKWPWWTWWTWWFLSTWSSRTHGTYASCRFPGIWADVRSDPTRTTQPCPSSSWATRSSITLGVWNAKWERSFTFPATRAANWKTWNSTNKWWCWHWRGRCGQPSWSPWAMDGEGNWGKSLEIFRRDQLIFGIIYHVLFLWFIFRLFYWFCFLFQSIHHNVSAADLRIVIWRFWLFAELFPSDCNPALDGRADFGSPSERHRSCNSSGTLAEIVNWYWIYWHLMALASNFWKNWSKMSGPDVQIPDYIHVNFGVFSFTVASLENPLILCFKSHTMFEPSRFEEHIAKKRHVKPESLLGGTRILNMEWYTQYTLASSVNDWRVRSGYVARERIHAVACTIHSLFRTTQDKG